jgi:hypothetical protein
VVPAALVPAAPVVPALPPLLPAVPLPPDPPLHAAISEEAKVREAMSFVDTFSTVGPPSRESSLPMMPVGGRV